jgi:hypothetical protein
MRQSEKKKKYLKDREREKRLNNLIYPVEDQMSRPSWRMANGGSSIQWNFKFYFEFLSPNAREGEGT